MFDLQLDAQNSYLFTYNTFIKILYMFRPLTGAQDSHLQRVTIPEAAHIQLTGAQDSHLQRVTIQEAAYIQLTGAQDNHLQRVTIPEAAYIQLRRRPPEDEQGNARNM